MCRPGPDAPDPGADEDAVGRAWRLHAGAGVGLRANRTMSGSDAVAALAAERLASPTCAARSTVWRDGRVAPGVATAGGGPSGRSGDRARHRRAVPAPRRRRPERHHLPASRPSLRPRESCPWLLTGELSRPASPRLPVVNRWHERRTAPTPRRSCLTARLTGRPRGAEIGPAVRRSGCFSLSLLAWRTGEERIHERVVTIARGASRCCWLGRRCGRRPVSRCSVSHVRHRHG